VLSPRGVHGHFPNWRGYSEYGTGGVGDWGAHMLDIAQWGLGMDNSGPVEVRPGKGRDQGATLVYANGITVIHKGGFGVSFFGAEGEVHVHRGRFKFVRKGEVIAEYTDATKGTSCDAQVVKAEKAFLKDAKIKLYNSTSHQDDFLACVAGRKKPVTSEQIGGRTAICCHLMNQAYLRKQVMKWDPDKFAFVGGTGDPKWLTRDARDPWKKT
jgi:predicted dehydrogenase